MMRSTQSWAHLGTPPPARLENSAFELLGLVLSRQVVSDAFGAAVKPCCWLLLDDIGGWLGHPGGELADILAIGLAEGSSAPRVELMVIESKCVGVAGVAAQAAKSRAQLEQTVRGLRRRLLDEGNDLRGRSGSGGLPTSCWSMRSRSTGSAGARSAHGSISSAPVT
jgi:hypothetical protein